MSAKDKALLIARIAEDKHAKNVVILNIKKLSSFADYLVICSVESDRQLRAVADDIDNEMRRIKDHPLGSEGLQSGRWALIDCNDVVVHVFTEATREHYDMDGMWAEAQRVDVHEVVKPVAKNKAVPAVKKAVAKKKPAPVVKKAVAKKKVVPAVKKVVAKKKPLPVVKKAVAKKKAAPVVKKVVAKKKAAPVVKKVVAKKKAAPVVKKVVAKKQAAPAVKKIVAKKKAATAVNKAIAKKKPKAR
ncbi:MAG: ribosome silencing factor [Deltaproteobacteria bacterium RIFCSPLOWO2_02_FULL_53_8]|nr:MAG: ribosome silencing factor [Deltaproteobacteria bacterium RIFCSPLOWO2_02_FULL_53_8]